MGQAAEFQILSVHAFTVVCNFRAYHASAVNRNFHQGSTCVQGVVHEFPHQRGWPVYDFSGSYFFCFFRRKDLYYSHFLV
jgi:hypothetical protein